MLQTNSWTCRQSLSASVLQTNFVCTRSPDRQTLQTNFVCRKSAKTWPKCRQILQTNFVCKKSAKNWAKLQTNLVDKLCLQKNPPRPGSKCRQILQTNLVKTENCRQLQKKCRQSLSSIVRKGLSILDKLCLYPQILELALGVPSLPGGGWGGDGRVHASGASLDLYPAGFHYFYFYYFYY